MTEVWKDVPDWPGYQASSLGRIRSLDRIVKYTGGSDRRLQGRVLKVHWRKKDGYGYVGLCRDGKPSICKVHQVIISAFKGPRPPGAEVRHRDGIPSHNIPENLDYGTRADNEADKVGHGTSNRGEQCGTARLTEIEIREIRQSDGIGSLALAKRYGVSPRHIRKIRAGQIWAWL